MTNRPKAIGTAAETAVVRAARRLGFPNADRLTLTGANDRGDIGLCPGVIVEVKGGEAARNASDALIEAWVAETERERRNAHATTALLVVQRRGVGAPNADRWHAYRRRSWIPDPYLTRHPLTDKLIERMSLAAALLQLRVIGYGEPIESDQYLDELRTRFTERGTGTSRVGVAHGGAA